MTISCGLCWNIDSRKIIWPPRAHFGLENESLKGLTLQRFSTLQKQLWQNSRPFHIHGIICTVLIFAGIRLIHKFSRERQPLHCDVIVGKQQFSIKLDRVSCTNYFMSIHNFRCSVQLIKIAKPDKKECLKNKLCPRCWR